MTKEEFKQARIALGLSQRKLARIIERNVRTIQRYESGDWLVSKVVEAKLDELLNKLKKE